MRRFLLASVLFLVALTDSHDAVRFIQPKSSIVLGSPAGVEVPIQVKITPHEDNRSYRIQWADGSSGKSLYGLDEPATQPAFKVRIHESQTIVATVFGAGGKVLGRTEFPIKVCGGENGCLLESKKPSK